MKNNLKLCICFILLCMSGCAQFSQSTQKVFKGLQMSQGMTQEEIDEEAHGGQMRNIK